MIAEPPLLSDPMPTAPPTGFHPWEKMPHPGLVRLIVAPADDVRLFAVAAGGQALGMPRRGPGLADLVKVRHEWQDGFAFAARVHQRHARHVHSGSMCA